MKFINKSQLLGGAFSMLAAFSLCAGDMESADIDDNSYEDGSYSEVFSGVSETSPSKREQLAQLTSYIRVLEKPLLIEPQPLPGGVPVTEQKKTNEFFELAAIFNDKLQQFLSVFDGSFDASPIATAHAQEEEIKATKPQNTCKSKRSS